MRHMTELCASVRLQAHLSVFIHIRFMAILFNSTDLQKNGLNLLSIFNLNELPNALIESLQSQHSNLANYRQLILIGHGGRTLWKSLPELSDSPNPIDDFTVKNISTHLEQQAQGKAYKIIYPSDQVVGLQALGELAGWHNPSPFMVGINKSWGSWFAYRAVILADTNFNTTPAVTDVSPCHSCKEKPCISACPANACGDEFNMKACLNYRQSENSKCKQTCLARLSCPVAKEHKYSKAQMKYHYGISMKMIEALNLGS